MNLDALSQELDRLYEFEIREYVARCDELKRQGFKIYRNESGQHKVALAGRQTKRAEEVQYSVSDKKESLPQRIVSALKNFANILKSLFKQ